MADSNGYLEKLLEVQEARIRSVQGEQIAMRNEVRALELNVLELTAQMRSSRALHEQMDQYEKDRERGRHKLLALMIANITTIGVAILNIVWRP